MNNNERRMRITYLKSEIESALSKMILSDMKGRWIEIQKLQEECPHKDEATGVSFFEMLNQRYDFCPVCSLVNPNLGDK